MPKPDATDVVYRYPEDGGGWVYVNDLALVPEAKRDAAERVTLSSAAKVEAEPAAEAPAPIASKAPAKPERPTARSLKKTAVSKVQAAQREVSGVLPFVRDLDAPSLAVGFACGLALMTIPSLLRRGGRLLLKAALVVVVGGLLVGAYLGWVQRSAGLGSGPLASPREMVREAEEAAEQMKDRLQKNERALERLEETSK